jgi:GNAT superfamily N-acetyltransferase
VGGTAGAMWDSERALIDTRRAGSAKIGTGEGHRVADEADEMQTDRWPLRLAVPADADEVARLLHDFNVEFATPTPEVEVLGDRLRRLLADEAAFAILAGRPAVAVALVTLRPNVWFEGPVALLDELYVEPHLRGCGIGATIIELLVTTAGSRGVALIEINVDEGDTDARRFYERHGFAATEPGSTERAFYYFRELT